MTTSPRHTSPDDYDMEDGSSTKEPDWNYATPALETLKKDLLDGYKLPPEPPSTPFSVKKLEHYEELSLQHYVAWQKSNGTVKHMNYMLESWRKQHQFPFSHSTRLKAWLGY
ncbi:hypothetical protein BDZ94DRAFT_1238945 [Collybia nuda]|uniref:Uncharacterized protein n=1 Tax=Collybia nuda TaxID=64659 RepID=A0A9P5Y1T2_9AGAR|nr:hypothetical protein BDZ94DRAFT_1238945 [Collybia nuda]